MVHIIQALIVMLLTVDAKNVSLQDGKVIRSYVPAFVQWDPPELEPYFWEPKGCVKELPDEKFKRLCRHNQDDKCAQSLEGWRMNGQYGRFNNALIELTNILIYSTLLSPPITIIFHRGGTFDRLIGLDNYDFQMATKWACVSFNESAWLSTLLKKQVPPRKILMSPARELFYLSNTKMSNIMREIIMGQILLRPSQFIRNKVIEFENNLPRSKFGYVVIHLRYLEGQCFTRISKGSWRSQRISLESIEPNITYEDSNIGKILSHHICTMSDKYIQAVLHMNSMIDYPIVLAHDGQQMERAKEIQERFAAVSYHGGYGLHVDMQLILRSQLLIGNPASTFSLNAVRIRCGDVRHHRESYSNLYCP